MGWRGLNPFGVTVSVRAGVAGRARHLDVRVASASLLTLVCIGSTVFAARSVSRSDVVRSRQAVSEASAQIASTFRLAIAREEELVVSAGVFDLQNPHASSAAFKRWTREEAAFATFPELSGIASLVLVPHSQLAAFEARAVSGPGGAIRPHGTFAIIPAGVRPYYCFLSLSQVRGKPSQVPPGVDYCASNPHLIQSRSSGKGYDYAISVPELSRSPLLAIETPLYRGGRIPVTSVGRSRAFVGWTGLVIAPRILLRSAIRDHAGFAVTLRDTTGSKILSFSAGRAPPHATRTMTNLHDGTTVDTYAVLKSAGILSNGNSRVLLLGGVLFSAILFLALVLLTGRSRALRLVSEKTRQLSFQATHDGLTGLPNRALVLDRAELMLARARRQDSSIATMFVDVDGFKQINDTFGHAAGDELLQVIASRLSSVVRETDTVGRLGGDEFILLVEGETLSGGPELVAERLLAVLRQPFELQGWLGRPQSCSASVGIAHGQRSTPDELFRDADLAMYHAKQAGRNRFSVFDESMRTSQPNTEG